MKFAYLEQSMRKSLSLLMLLSLMLCGCNLPIPNATAVPTPTVDILATQVSIRLTAAATATKALGPTAASSSAASSATVSATKVTPSATAAAPTKSSTPAITSTGATATLTPTPIPGDPKASLGDPTWRDTFQKPSSWGLASAYDDGHTRVSMPVGKIILQSVDANNWRGWRTQTGQVQNFYMEATIKTQTCSGSDLYGLVFRATSDTNGYWLGFTCDGNYLFQTGGINGFTDVIKAKPNSAILSGSNQVNRIGVMAKGNALSFYANGKLLESVTNNTYPAAGVFGYFIAGTKTPSFTFESTEIAYWNLP
jgi:hypothetical protein